VKKTENDLASLANAAADLDEELLRFEHLAAEVAKQPLDSQRGLERAAELLKQAAGADEKVAARVAALVAAIGIMRRQREAAAEVVQKRAEEIASRSNAFSALLETYRGIGSSATEITSRLQSVIQAPVAERENALAEVRHRVAELVSRSQDLIRAADEQGFADVARQAESLRQQLLQGLNKVSLVVKRLPS
jgi:chromosome segregation ATPase